MKQINIDLHLPFIRSEISAKSSKTEKPSGLGYLILKMVNSAPGRDKKTLSEILFEFGIPMDMFPLFALELEALESNGMITVNEWVSTEMYTDSIELTKVGREAFERGVISKGVKDFSATLVYLPARTVDRFYKEGGSPNKEVTPTQPDDAIMKKFVGVETDQNGLEEFISGNPSLFNVRANEEIFDIKIESCDMGFYKETLRINFDEVYGSFSPPDKGNVDSTFIKSRYTSDDIFAHLDEKLFTVPSSRIESIKWSDTPTSWAKHTYILPSGFNFRDDSIVVVRPGAAEVYGKYYEYDLSEMDADLAIVELGKMTLARFVRDRISISGFDGTTAVNLVHSRPMTGEEAAKIGSGIASRLNLKKDLVEYIKICEDFSMAEKIPEAIVTALSESKFIEYATIIEPLYAFSSKKWFKELSGTLETAIIKSLKSGERPMDAISLVASLESKIPVQGISLIPEIYRGKPDGLLGLVDAGLKTKLNGRLILNESRVLETAVPDVLAGKTIPGDSDLFRDLTTISYNLKVLKGLTGITSIVEYYFDKNSMNSDEVNKFTAASTTLTKKCRELNGSKYGEILREHGFGKVMEFEDFFSDIAAALNSSEEIMDKDALLKESNVRLFGIQLGLNLESRLKDMGLKGTIAEMIDEAVEKKLISENDRALLKDIKDFRNECAHVSGKKPTIDKKEKRKWVNAVFSLTTIKADEE